MRSSFTDDEMDEAEWLAEYERRTENHQSRDALDAERTAQHDVFMKADAQMNAIPEGRAWNESNWKNGLRVD